MQVNNLTISQLLVVSSVLKESLFSTPKTGTSEVNSTPKTGTSEVTPRLEVRVVSVLRNSEDRDFGSHEYKSSNI